MASKVDSSVRSSPRKQALASLAQIVEFRRYAMALLAEAVGHMDPVEPFMALDQITNDKVQQQLTCLVAFIQGADWTESLILEGQYIKAAVRSSRISSC